MDDIQAIRKEYIVAQSFAYLFASIFFLTLDVNGAIVLISQIFGTLFLLAAIITVVAPFNQSLLRLGESANGLLRLGLFSATLGLLLVTWIESWPGITGWVAWTIRIGISLWLFLFVIEQIFDAYSAFRKMMKRIGLKNAFIRLLVILSFSFSAIGVSNIMLDTKAIAEPLLLIGVSVLLLSMAFLLDYYKLDNP